MALSSSTMSTLGIGFGLRQLYPYGGPDALLGADRDLAVHLLHEIPANRQAETSPIGGNFPRVEAFEEVGEILLSYAYRFVLDGNRCSGDAQRYRVSGIRMLYGVCDGDQERLLEQRGVGDDPCRLAFDSHVEPRALGQGFRHLGRGLGDLREVDWFKLGLSRAPADAGELEEGVGEPTHPFGPSEYVFEEASAGDGIVLALGRQELRREGDRGERGPQLGGRPGQKLLWALPEPRPLGEVLGPDHLPAPAAVAQVRHVLELDPQEGFPPPYAGFPAFPLPGAAGDRLAQVEVLPRIGKFSVVFVQSKQ